MGIGFFARVVVITDDADENAESSQGHSDVDRFAGEKIPEQHSHDRIHVSVGPDLRRGFVVNQPDVGR